MDKIISFDNLKKFKEKENSDKNEKDYTHLAKLNEIFSLLEDVKNEEALKLAEETLLEYGYKEDICEVFSTTIIVGGDHFSDEDFSKYYTYLKKFHSTFPDNEKIASYMFSFCLAKIAMAKQAERDNYDFSELFEQIYKNFPNNESIVLHYATSFLIGLDLYDTKDDSEHENIFDNIVSKYVSLLVDSEDFDDLIANEFAKFVYLSAVKTENKEIVEKSFGILKNIYDEFDEDEEIATYYCLYISKYLILDNSIQSMKAIAEFKEITNKFGSFVFNEIFFLSLYNLTTDNTYENNKFALSQMKTIIYSLEDSEESNKRELVELYAEALSNCSCDTNLSVVTINNEILPMISALIKDFGQIENLVVEYCIVLYNISCLINYYEGEDAPHVDVIEELKNCAEFFDSAIPYYCLSLSNLIHLNDKEFGYDVVSKIKIFVDDYDVTMTPTTKNNISLLSIYIMAITNLIDILPADECEELLELIANIIDPNEKTAFVSIDKEFNEFEIQLLFQYIRALAFYVNKLNKIDTNFLKYSMYMRSLDNLLNEQEL